jgi:2-polyprenyl-3-methyl-5-hydroxy-6-metoxy-1,4-benzoquinol methylase
MKQKKAEEYYNEKWKNAHDAYQRKFFTKEEPQNLSQFFFLEQYKILADILNQNQLSAQGSILEVGCGRGTTSAYLGYNGYTNLNLLDSSEMSIQLAKNNFEQDGLSAQFYVDNAKNMSINTDTFDVVFSMGLLEHFEDPTSIVNEKIRVLKKGGLFVAFILPQKLSAENLNSILKPFLILFRKIERKFQKENKKFKNSIIQQKSTKKHAEVYRNKLMVNYYMEILFPQLQDIDNFWVNPFPFLTPTSKNSQKLLVKIYYSLMTVKKNIFRYRTPYATNSLMGSGFFIYGIKK